MTTKTLEGNSLFWEHVEELRLAFLKSAAVIAFSTALLFAFFPYVFDGLTEALTAQPLVLLTPLEGISSTLKTSFWLALAGSYPIWGLFFLRFILPGLRTKEQGIARGFFFSSLLSLILGGYIGITYIIPPVSALFSKINEGLGENLWTVSGALSFELLALCISCLVFQLAATLILLLHFRLISWQWLATKRRQAYVALFVLSAAITPPDVITQLFTALPLVAFFELALIYARFKETLFNSAENSCTEKD